MIAEVLLEKEAKRILNNESINPVVLTYVHILINECLTASKYKQAINLHHAACDVAEAYKLFELKSELVILRKKITITKFVERQQWQLAIQVVTTRSSESFLFNLLKEVRTYIRIRYFREHESMHLYLLPFLFFLFLFFILFF